MFHIQHLISFRCTIKWHNVCIDCEMVTVGPVKECLDRIWWWQILNKNFEFLNSISEYQRTT